MAESRSLRGSVSLTYVYSTIAALGFSLLTYNFAHYLSAQSAVEQAVRAAARCISPTDGECTAAAVQPADPGAIVTRWYGYPVGEAEVQAATDLFDYTAGMHRRTTNAAYNSFEIQWDHPVAVWEDTRIPLVSFSVQLNKFQNVFGTMVLPTFQQSDSYAPLHEGAGLKLFPPVAVEDNIMNHASPAQMVAWQADFGNNVSWTTHLTEVAGWQQLPPLGSALTVQTDWIAAPPLQALECRTGAGAHCNDAVNAAAGDDLPQEQWHQFARVALIPMALVRNSGDEQSGVSWSRPGAEGLQMEVRDSSGNPWATYCLGGRRKTNFGPGQMWFNMDIRGPAGANDGAAGACGGAGGLGDFDALRVPRGGSFRIRAFLRRHDANVAPAKLEVNVRFLVTTDEYGPGPTIPGPNISCSAVRFSTASSTPLCGDINFFQCQNWSPDLTPDVSACEYPWWPAYYTWDAVLPSCVNDGHAFVITPQMRPFDEVPGPQDLAVCEAGWEPLPEEYPPAPPGSIQCGGWISTPSVPADIQVGALQGMCPLAVVAQRQFICENGVPHGMNQAGGECSGLAAEVDPLAIAAATSALNLSQQQVSGAPLFSSELEISAAPQPETSWEFSWSNKFEGILLSAPEQIRPAGGENPKNLPEEYAAVSWRQIAGGYAGAQLDQFYPLIRAHAGHDESAYGWNDFVGGTDAWLVSTDDFVPVVDVWPYSPEAGAQPRPYHSQTPLSGPFDYNLDCILEPQCDEYTGGQADGLEAVLRSLASASASDIPALDPELEFDWSETYDRTEVRTDLSPELYPPCTQHRTQCNTSHAELTYLGEGSSLPPECESGAFINCYSETSTSEFSPGETEASLNFELAELRALEEVQRLIPYARLCSAGPGCTAVSITNEAEGRARIRVGLQSPLSPPLSNIVGLDSLHVEAQQDIALELLQVGS